MDVVTRHRVGPCWTAQARPGQAMRRVGAKEARHTAFGRGDAVEDAVVLCEQLIKLGSGNLFGRDHGGRAAAEVHANAGQGSEMRCRLLPASRAQSVRRPGTKRGGGSDENAGRTGGFHVR